MNKTITFSEAFDLASKLNNPDILGIKDTEFGLAVYKNLTTIIEVYSKLQEEFKPSIDWTKITEGVTTEDGMNKLKKKKANKEIFEIREKQMLEYNKILRDNYDKLLIKIKIKNLKTRLSAQDIIDLKPMLTI